MRHTIAVVTLLAAALAACSTSATAPKQVALVDPPAMVHAINRTTQQFEAWTVIIGPDSQHTALAFQSSIAPDTSTRYPGPMCLSSAQVAGERQFIEAAVAPGSALDRRLLQLSSAGVARDRWADSVARGLIDVPTMLASYAGFIAASNRFDPAPPQFTFPPDTVPWRWTVTDTGAVVVLDTADHACVRRP